MINRVTKNDSWAVNPDGSLGYTANLITGCLNHTDGFCKGGGFPCFAYKTAHGRVKNLYLANKNYAPSDGLPHGLAYIAPEIDPFYPRFWPERLDELDWWLAARKEPVGVFLNIMGEWLGDWVPESWQNWIMELVRRYPEHRFYLLTKQPQNLPKWAPYPDNCRVGVTITNNDAYYQAFYGKPWGLIDQLEAEHVFLSFEPLLERMTAGQTAALASDFKEARIGQVIIGAQTKPKKMPEWDWVKEIINAADEVGTAVFLKYNLGLPKYDCDGGIPFYFKSLGTMELRQEVPHSHA